MNINEVKKVDPEVYAAIAKELGRQKYTLELIASENIVSPAVMAAQGCIMTNKYAEGYPAHRYYGGCEHVDIVEKLAIDRAKKLFGAEAANVQPHSGSQANMGVYFALLNPGDTILGMNLAHGGHLTHGSPVNFSGRLFRIVPYGVNPKTCRIDFDELEKIALREKPKMIIAGASAYPRELDFAKFAEIARKCGSLLMVDMAHIAGLVAAGIHQTPVVHADVVTSTTHKTLRGPRGGLILSRQAYAKKLNKEIFPGMQGGPLMHVIASKAVALKEALMPEFKQYQAKIVANAKALAKTLMENDIDLVSGGTDNHMMLVDLRNLEITGKDAEAVLEKAGITVNKNGIPFDTTSPMVTSGIRIGTPVLTSRGMKENEMKEVGVMISDILKNMKDRDRIMKTRHKVEELCRSFPVYEHIDMEG